MNESEADLIRRKSSRELDELLAELVVLREPTAEQREIIQVALDERYFVREA